MAISTRFLLLLSFLCCVSQTTCAGTETVRTDPCESDSMYQTGSHFVANATVHVKRKKEPDWHLWVALPKVAAKYPVVQFQHGFKLHNTDYEELIKQVASWGFIVVAPQMYKFGPAPEPRKEIKKARSILDWMKDGLINSLPKEFASHEPDFSKVALAGHSRGGMVVFSIALNSRNASQNISAIVGLDPVDTDPPTVLTHEPCTMDVGVPSLIVGTGLGNHSLCRHCPSCAPNNQSHTNFYADVTPPSFHFVATNSGHLDFTDDCNRTKPIPPFRCLPICKAGPKRQCMPQFSAGILVAFLQDVLFGDSSSFSAALKQEVKAPVDLDVPEWKGNITYPHEAYQYADI